MKTSIRRLSACLGLFLTLTIIPTPAFGAPSQGTSIYLPVVHKNYPLSWIAFSSLRNSERNIYVISPFDLSERQVTKDVWRDSNPDWSPNGERIAFDTNRGENHQLSDIYVMDAEGTNIDPRTDNSRIDFGPAWSPDGTKIAFSSQSEPGLRQIKSIFIMNADGSNLMKLTQNDNWRAFHPTWSPDASQIAFVADQADPLEEFELYVMNSDGTNIHRITDGLSIAIQPDWSHHGNRIVFASARDGDNQIYCVNADGSGLVQLTSSADGDNFDPSWSPDDSRIVFVSDRDGNNEIYIMDADGSDPVRLTNNTFPDESPDWSPLIK